MSANLYFQSKLSLDCMHAKFTRITITCAINSVDLKIKNFGAVKCISIFLISYKLCYFLFIGHSAAFLFTSGWQDTSGNAHSWHFTNWRKLLVAVHGPNVTLSMAPSVIGVSSSAARPSSHSHNKTPIQKYSTIVALIRYLEWRHFHHHYTQEGSLRRRIGPKVVPVSSLYI